MRKRFRRTNRRQARKALGSLFGRGAGHGAGNLLAPAVGKAAALTRAPHGLAGAGTLVALLVGEAGISDSSRRSDVLWRAVGYGIAGWCMEVLWTGARSGLRGDRKLEAKTYLWMFPIYALAAPLFEPLHDALRRLPAPLRAAIYAAGIMTVEYATGWALDKATGQCPWDYSEEARFHLNGYVRLDYAPAWAVAGLLLERVHDFFDSAVPAVREARV